MIFPALDYICNELTKFIKEKSATPETAGEKKVSLINLVEQDGSIDHLPQDKVLCSLINVEEEKKTNNQAFKYVENANGYVKRNADLNLNLYILFVAFHKHYAESLKSLSNVISFFQQKKVFNTILNQGGEQEPTKLVLELYTPSFEQINQLWGALGAKYAPSLMYKVRMITIQSDVDLEQVGIVDEVSITSNNSADSSIADLKEQLIQKTLNKTN